MDRRLPILVVLVVLAGTAGCSALLDGGGATTDTATPTGDVTSATPTPDATPSQATAEPTATPEGTTPTPTATPTATPAPTRTFDASDLQDAHVAALGEAGSFQTSSALVIRNETTTRYVNGSYAVEADGPVLNTANITDVTDEGTRDYPVTTRYTAGDTTYERRFEDDGTVYRKGTAPYNDSDPEPVDPKVAFRLGRIAVAVVDASTWTVTGNGTIDGANVTRYDVDGEGFDAAGYPNADGAATLVVDEAGIVRYAAYRFEATPDGNRTEYVYEAGYSAIGNTTVERPAWTQNA
jgi:hypothetical protein